MIPLATTTITLRRTEGGGDPYEEDDAGVVATKVQAHVSGPGGVAAIVGGHQELVDAALFLAPSPRVERADLVTDDLTDECYLVTWVRRRTGLGLDHQIAGLTAVKGASNG